jgi:hypothetical protein
MILAFANTHRRACLTAALADDSILVTGLHGHTGAPAHRRSRPAEEAEEPARSQPEPDY